MPPSSPLRRLYQGRVVEAAVLNRIGSGIKKRPLVIITPTDEIQNGKPFQVVCCSTQGEKYPSVYNVYLPGPRQGRKDRSGLSEESVAVCEWVETIRETDISGILGHLRPTHLLEVLENRKIIEQKEAGLSADQSEQV